MTINIKGCLMDLRIPKIMGILNVTPDSFYTNSRAFNEKSIRERVEKMIEEGVEIIDVGGCSTRPGYQVPSIEEEWERVNMGCKIIRYLLPEIPLSIDTFRNEVATRAIREWDADIINDISGGNEELWHTVAKEKVVYVLTHNNTLRGIENIDPVAKVITDLSWKLNELHRLGVNDMIIDPGFGFAKTIEENFQIFNNLQEIAKMGFPVLVGISRKSMIYKTVDKTPEESLNGTIAMEAIALEKGANILRVHDVKESVELVKLFTKLKFRR